MISGQVPAHLVAGARSGFLTAMRNINPLWRRVATMITVDGKTTDIVDLGGAPMPKKSKAGLTMQDMVERALQVKPDDWDITVHISYDAVQDDRTSTLWTRVTSAGDNFNKHINKLVFEGINGGAAVTDIGAGYDGVALFSANHIDPGANYQIAQSNINTLALTPDNFETVYVAASTRLDDQGEQTGFMPNLLIVPPHLEREAVQITGNREQSGTANRDINPWFGSVNHIVVPWLDATAWYVGAEGENVKPLLVVMRQNAFLQDAWFDREKPDGGWYCFKFFARYSVAPAEWRLLTQGNT